MNSKKTRKAIGAIIFHNNKFLVLSRSMIFTTEGFKKIPLERDLLKGGIDKGESPKEALLRELYEETGSKKYMISKKFKNRLSYGLPKSTGFDRQEVTMFLVEYVGDEKDLKPDKKEIAKLQFFNKKDTLKKITYPETKEFFKKYIESDS
jgi:putative (di)nucleoside polyphosphate hydrolase